jgi:hypothetical protein
LSWSFILLCKFLGGAGTPHLTLIVTPKFFEIISRRRPAIVTRLTALLEKYKSNGRSRPT